MKKEQRIYCIEGHHDWGNKEVEPSVEPMLQLLQRMGQWSYARRDCATKQEWEFWIEQEWHKRCNEGSILYIAAHGTPGYIWLTDKTSISIHELADGYLDCSGCLVHFGACSVLAKKEKDNVQKFMNDTRAVCVTGYGSDVGWTGAGWAPALALELILFSSIWDGKIHHNFSGRIKRLQKLVNDIKNNELFKSCCLELYPLEE